MGSTSINCYVFYLLLYWLNRMFSILQAVWSSSDVDLYRLVFNSMTGYSFHAQYSSWKQPFLMSILFIARLILTTVDLALIVIACSRVLNFPRSKRNVEPVIVYTFRLFQLQSASIDIPTHGGTANIGLAVCICGVCSSLSSSTKKKLANWVLLWKTDVI